MEKYNLLYFLQLSPGHRFSRSNEYRTTGHRLSCMVDSQQMEPSIKGVDSMQVEIGGVPHIVISAGPPAIGQGMITLQGEYNIRTHTDDLLVR